MTRTTRREPPPPGGTASDESGLRPHRRRGCGTVLRLRYLAAAPALAALALAGSAGVASAASPVTKVTFTANYLESNPLGGEIGASCTGVHTDNTKTGIIEDNEHCVLSGDTEGMAPGVYTGDPTGVLPPFTPASPTVTWESDYNGVEAISWTMVITADGSSGAFKEHIVAYY
jgi:hypothetical protein